jgi:hypothetical protein
MEITVRALVLIATLIFCVGSEVRGQEPSLATGRPEVELPVPTGGGLGCVITRQCSEAPSSLEAIGSMVETLSADPVGGMDILGEEYRTLPCFADPSCRTMLQGWAVGVDVLAADNPHPSWPIAINPIEQRVLLMPDVLGCLGDSECSAAIDAFVEESADAN